MTEWLKNQKALAIPANPDLPYSDPAPTPGGETTAAPAAAGRTLDAVIAEKIFGWPGFTSVPYSTEIAAAWLVLDWIRSQRDVVCLSFDSRDNRWEIDACDHIDYDTNLRDDGSKPRGCAVIVHAETAPLVICRAALSLASTNRAADPGDRS